MTNTV